MLICPSCGEENSDRARFCQRCATPLGGAEEPAGEVRKVVTIVFADVTGSTELGERLDPEALRRVMGRYFDRMEAVIHSHAGTVEKFIGDAIMAVFGIPRLSEEDPLRAVRAASGMREALDALNVELARDHGVGIQVRIGINTGEVVAGDPSRGQRLVTGDVVNVAARLEQVASPGQVLIGETTHRLVKDAVVVEPVEPLTLKGKSGHVSAYRLVTVLADVAGHERHLDSPIVGRSKELELLDRALDRARTERTSHLFTLLGPAGVGKSRLVSEFLDRQATSVTVRRGRCLSYGEGITFFPFAGVLQDSAGIAEADPPATALSKLAALLADAPDGDRIAQLLAGLVGWSDAGASEDAFWAVRKLFEHLARDRPLVIVFDDIHWAEPTFLDLIEHLADWTRDAALLLLCIARPELLEIRAGWGGGKMNATSILLEPLPMDQAALLVDNLLGKAEIPQAARDRILEAAEGNPLFVEEMLGMLIDDGLLRFEDGTWRSVEDLADLTVPPTIQLLLAARLDRLDAEERAVIERGSVEGKVFHTGAVTLLSPESLRSNVPSRLLALARKELIRPDRAEFAGEDAFRFRHLLIRDAAYQAMPKEHRADLHERFAGWLERAAGDRLPEYEEILAYHLEQAYRYRIELGPADERTKALGAAAGERLSRSAERARERGDFSSARALLRRAAPITDGVVRAHVLLDLAQNSADLNDFGECVRVAREAVTVATDAGARALAIRADVALCDALGHVDPAYTQAQATRDLEDALAELRELEDPEGIVEATLLAARFAFYDGRCERCREIVVGLVADAESWPYQQRHALAVNLTVSAYFGPMPATDALDELERARAIVGESLASEAARDNLRIGLLAMLGREEDVDLAIDRNARRWDEIGDPGARVPYYLFLGEANRFLERPHQAESSFRTGVQRLTDLGETGYNSTMLAIQALSLCDLGRFEEAEAAARRGRDLSSADDFATQSAWRVAQARVTSSRGAHAEALALVDEAIAINDTTDYIAWQGEALEIRGQILVAAGRVDEAKTAFAEALERYDRKGIVTWAGRVRARLDALTA